MFNNESDSSKSDSSGNDIFPNQVKALKITNTD